MSCRSDGDIVAWRRSRFSNCQQTDSILRNVEWAKIDLRTDAKKKTKHNKKREVGREVVFFSGLGGAGAVEPEVDFLAAPQAWAGTIQGVRKKKRPIRDLRGGSEWAFFFPDTLYTKSNINTKQKVIYGIE